MRNWNKIMSILVVLLLVISMLTACSSSNSVTSNENENVAKNENNDTTKSPKNDSEEAKAKIDTSEFVEIVWYHLGDPPTNGQLELAAEEWNKILKEKVNASLTIKFIEWADYLTK